MNAEELLKRVTIDRLPLTTSYVARTQKIPISKAADLLNDFYETYKHEGLIARYSSCKKSEAKINERAADFLVKIGDTGDRIFSVQIDHSSLANVVEMCRGRWDSDTITACELIRTRTYETKASIKDDSVITNDLSDVKAEIKKEIKTEAKPAAKMEHTKRPTYTSRKAATTGTTPSMSPSSKLIYTSRKRRQDQSQTKIQSQEKQEPVAKRAKTEPTKTEVSKELEELMEDDFTDDDDLGVTEYKYDDIDVSAPEPENEKKNTDDDVVPNDDFVSEPSNPIERIAIKDITKSFKESVKPIQEEELPEVETHTDADGYIVTKINRKTPQPQQTIKKYIIDTKSKSNASAKSGIKQSSIASFFGKKK